MAHLDIYLEKCPGFGWEGAPEKQTTVVYLRNGRSRRIARRRNSAWSFVLPFDSSFPEAYDNILDTFEIVDGRLHAFRVRNYLKYRAVDQLFAYGDGVTDEFQLGRLIEIGGLSKLVPIHALSLDPAAPAPIVTVNGTPAAAVFNDRTGRVLFDTPPAVDAELEWSGWWDHWVRFASDRFPAAIENKSGGELVSSYRAELEEAEPPDEGFSS